MHDIHDLLGETPPTDELAPDSFAGRQQEAAHVQTAFKVLLANGEQQLESVEEKAWAKTKRLNQEAYVELVAEGYSYSEAGSALGVARTTQWQWRQNPEFKARLEAARGTYKANLVEEAHRRAMKGSDRLLEFLLKAEDPAKYNPAQKLEHSGQVDVVAILNATYKRVGGD